MKQPSDIFARYLLKSAKQESNQTLADFKCSLVKLSKDCIFKDVSATQYRDDLIRDSFISGIYSPDVRQRLLEHKTLTLNDAYEIAVTIDDAKRDNRVFCSTPADSVGESPTVNFVESECKTVEEPVVSAAFGSRKSCYKCGSKKPHDFKKCKAGSLQCYKCGERGHISRVCSSRSKASTSNSGNSASFAHCSESTLYSVQESLSSISNESASPVSVFTEIKGVFL